tara:strand:+ start:797 stop:1150 length:354 start_codon:yes stop_codon:yes gene_type:complete
MSGPFKMKGSSFYGHGNSSPAKQESKTYKQSKEEGTYTKQGRSHTPGPVVGSIWDTDPNAPKTSTKIGPVESPEAIQSKRKDWKDTEASEEAKGEYFSDKSEEKRIALTSARDYEKR